ncbi:MAG: transglycosylase domain-containing protein [Alphaproteobacteria bacterium]
MYFISFCVWSGLILGGITLWYGWDLPNPAQLSKTASRAPSYKIFDENNQLLLQTGQTYGKPVNVEMLPAYIPESLLALEDHRFYYHFGLDPIGLARALYVNLTAGTTRQGGSTITQQLAKTLFLTPERTLRRKAQEALLAIWLEIKFTKPQLLNLYLSRVYMGGGNWGFDAAARAYFNKPLQNITLKQAAMLAGLPLAPSRLNPLVNAKGANARANIALNRMQALGYITDEQAKAGIAQAPNIQSPLSLKGYGNQFARFALGRAIDVMGNYGGDLYIHTSLSPTLQQSARKAIGALSQSLNTQNAGELAMFGLAQDGAIKAMIGGRDTAYAGFNRATQALRQPGSAFKLFVYLTAFEQGISPSTNIDDRPFNWAGWQPTNYNDKHQGMMNLNDAFARSNNVIAAKLAQTVGLDNVIDMATRLGIYSKLHAQPALSLGASELSLYELVTAYASLNQQGVPVEPYAITHITDHQGNILYQRQPPAPLDALNPASVNAMKQLLEATVNTGTAKGARLDPYMKGAGKTGTSQNYRDAWFVGMIAPGSDDLNFQGLTLGIWLGNDDNRAMKQVTGGGLPACLWQQTMKYRFNLESLAHDCN